MKLCLIFILFAAVLTCNGFAQIKEPKSDPSMNAPAPPTDDSIDDAAEVHLRPSPTRLAADDSDDSDPPPKPVTKVSPDNSPSLQFSVTRVRMEPQHSGNASRTIQLLSPHHNSTYTPGVITFSWKVVKPTKKRFVVFLKVERLDGKKKYSRKLYKEKKLLDLSPGEYKWQVTTDKPGQETRWRIVKVIGMKSHSLTELYNGKTPDSKKSSTKKTLPEVSDYIIDLDGPDEDEVRIPASDTFEPLPAPTWIHHHSSSN